MLVQRALKIRLYPTQEQANYLNQVIGNSRFIYNQMLNERINFYKENKDNKDVLYKHKYKTEKQYKEEL
jgi:putative transposase